MSFTPLPDRDASDTICGFVYQVQRTILAWIELPPETVLFCESGEDIDYARQAFADETSPASRSRLLEQVKDLARNLTLRSSSVQEALANYLAVREQNPALDLQFRFLTTADAGRERGLAFPLGLRGLEAWMAVRAGELSTDQQRAVLATLRELFDPALPAEDLTAEGRRIANFLQERDDDSAIANFIRPFEFSLGNLDSTELPALIATRLVERRIVATELEAQGLYRTLFTDVFHLLSQSGDKRLDRAALRRSADEYVARGVGIDILARVEQLLTRQTEELRQDLARISGNVDQIARNMGAAQQEELLRTILADFLGTPSGNLAASLHVQPYVPAPPALPPALPELYLPREALIETLAREVIARHWVAITGSTGMGKTYLARDLFVGREGYSRRWVSLRGQGERGEQHLREELWGWLDNLGIRVAAAEFARRSLDALLRDLFARTAGRFLLVLDDLPDLTAQPQLAASLAGLAGLLRRASACVVSTSQYPLPEALRAITGRAGYDLQIPPLTVDEVRALFTRAGGPPDLTRRIAAFVHGRAQGHPLLVTAAIRWLRQQGWAFDDVRFGQLLRGDPLGAVQREARRALRQLVIDDTTCSLLDRLSLVGDDFPLATVTAVGTVAPIIAHPELRLHDLVGPWIEMRADGTYEVSPMLAGVGESYLGETTKRATHRAIAEVTLRARTISVAEALPLCTHLIQAEDWDAFMPVFVQLLQVAETQEQAAALDWAAMLFSPDARWPEAFSPSMRIMIRTLQIRLLDLADKPIAKLVTDLETLLGSVGDERADQLAVGFARFHLGLVRDDLSALAQARNAREAARALRRSLADEDTLPFVPESVLWLALLQANGYQELRDLFAELRGMPPEERAAVFANPPSLETYLLLVDRVIGAQGTPPGAADASTSLALLTELATFGREAGLPSLIVAAARGIAIVQADRLGRLDQALDTLRQAPGGDLPFARFVLAWTEGRLLVAHDPTRDAFLAFAEALAVTPTADFPIYRAEALSYGMAAAARSGRWPEARRWAGEAIRHVGLRARPDAPDPWEGLKLLGELAWIHSLAGDRGRAVGALFAIVRRLAAVDEPPTKQFRALVMRLGYLLQWLASIATTGQPPDAEMGEKVYTEPVSGFLAHSGDPEQLPGDTIGLDALCWQLGRYAGASGSLRIARWAYVQSAARARRDSHYGKAVLADGLSAALETWLGNIDAGLDAALSGARAIMIMPTEAPDELDLAPDALDQRWSALPADRRAAEQGFHLFHGVLWPTITRLLGSGADLATAERALDRLMIGLNRSSVTIVEFDRWRRMVASARAIFARTLRRAELTRLLDVPMENYERCILYSTLMRATDSLPSEVVQAQVVILLFTREGRKLGEFVRDSFARWLVDYWRVESAERSFRLASPGLLRSELATVVAGTTEVGDAVRVLLAAALASGVRLPAEMHAGLQQLRSR